MCIRDRSDPARSVKCRANRKRLTDDPTSLRKAKTDQTFFVVSYLTPDELCRLVYRPRLQSYLVEHASAWLHHNTGNADAFRRCRKMDEQLFEMLVLQLTVYIFLFRSRQNEVPGRSV